MQEPKINPEDLEYIQLQDLTELERRVFTLQLDKTGDEELEAWVYEDEELQKLLSENDYLDLISVDYHASKSPYEAIKILENYVDQKRFYEFQLRETLKNIVIRNTGYGVSFAECYSMYCDGYDFMRDLGLRYGSRFFDDLETASKSKARFEIDNFYPEVIYEATKILNWLNTEKIIILGSVGEYQAANYRDLKYIDNRNT